MASFRNAKEKASHAIRSKVSHGTPRHSNKDSGQIHSVGTERNYTQSLKGAQGWLDNNRLGDLTNITKELAEKYLLERASSVTQKTLDLDRQALQIVLEGKLERIKSLKPPGHLAIKTRAYTTEQVQEILKFQSEKNGLSTELSTASGVRAHELLTLRLASERGSSPHREWSSSRFEGRKGVLYTVIGKGGLVTEKLIPFELAERLESRKLELPRKVRDRGVNYLQYYDIPGGKKWSANFSKASMQALGFSNGGHGLRHSYAQNREKELQALGYKLDDARGIVAQEMSHFSPKTTRSYER